MVSNTSICLAPCVETPPYLRRALIARHADLAKVGGVPRLNAPHHLRVHDECEYREGVVVPEPPECSGSGGGGGDGGGGSGGGGGGGGSRGGGGGGGGSGGGGGGGEGGGGGGGSGRKAGKSRFADVGLIGGPVRLDRAVRLGVRVTVHLPPPGQPLGLRRPEPEGRVPGQLEGALALGGPEQEKPGGVQAWAAVHQVSGQVSGRVVSPAEPRGAGHYWGYTIRVVPTANDGVRDKLPDLPGNVTYYKSEERAPETPCVHGRKRLRLS